MEKIGKKCRELMVDELANRLKQSQNIILTNYKGLTVAEIEKLKNALGQISVNFTVVKNSVLKRVFERLNLEKATELMDGAVAIGFGGEGVVGISRVLINFKKNHSPLVIRGGFLDRDFVFGNVVSEIAMLPTREVLLAKFIGATEAPIRKFVGGLSAILRKLVCVVDAIKNKSNE